MSISNRTFGVELEILLPRGITRDRIAREIAAVGLQSEHESYNHRQRGYWKVTTDGSVSPTAGQRNLSGGAEVVSPILTGEQGIADARKVADVLKALGCTVNKTCGFHVHVGASELNADQVKRVALNFVWFEDFFDHIMPPSRRGNSATGYCRSNRARMGEGYGTSAVNAWFPRLEMDAINTAIAGQSGYASHSVANLTEVQKVVWAFSGATPSNPSRYFKLNMAALYRHSTVEFRQHSGTVDADKVEHWIRLMVGFVDKSIVSRPRPRTVTRDLKPAEEMNRFFAYMGGFVPDTTKRYYAARRVAIATQGATEQRERADLLANAETIARDAIATLTTRRDRAVSMRRPQVRIAQRLADQIQSLDYSIRGSIPYGTASRDEAMSNAIRRARAAFPDLLPSGARSDVELATAA